LDPSNLKARQYIQYVRENFESLADYFGRVIDQPPPSPDGTTNWPGGQSPAEQVAQLASGWELEDEFVPDALPPPPTSAPVPSGIEVPPTPEWAARPPSFEGDLASVAHAVLEPFGIELTPPRSAHEP